MLDQGAVIDEVTGYQQVRPDLIFGDLQKVLPPRNRLNSVYVEYCPRALKDERRYRAVVQYARPNYGVTDAYAPSAALALYRLEAKMKKIGWG